MATTYENPTKLTAYADSVMTGGRNGRSSVAYLVDFAKVGAAAATGLVTTDIIDNIGGLPDNCVMRSVAAQVVRPITTLAGDAPAAIPLTLKAGTTTLAAMTLADVNGPTLGIERTDVSLSDGATGVAGAKTDLSILVGAVLDADSDATAITGGMLMIVLNIDYMPEPDELSAWFDTITEVSDGGNTAEEVTAYGPSY